MIYSQATGGFGNQLYNYAIGFALSKKNNDTLTIDLSAYEFSPRPFVLDKLTISAQTKSIVPAKSPSKISRMIARIGRHFYTYLKGGCKWIHETIDTRNQYGDYNFTYKNNLYLEGYWQNYRYFHEFRSELMLEFRPQSGLLSKNANRLIESFSMNKNSIAVHLRKGDYEDSWVLPKNYYEDAFNYMLSKIKNPEFVIFCEDHEYARFVCSSIASNITYITKDFLLNDLDEFYVMSSCNHQIIANSTFSWWSAYLNSKTDKIIVAPIYMHWKKDYYPDEWITINFSL